MKKSKQPRTLVPLNKNAKGKNKRIPKKEVKGNERLFIRSFSKFHD